MKAMRMSAAIVICGALSGCAGGPRPEESKPLPNYASAKLRDLSEPEKAAVGVAVARGLKDPGSAQFRWNKIVDAPPGEEGIPYCAMVNAKNSFGGYIGFKPYVAMVLIDKGKATGAKLIGVAGSANDTYAVETVCRDSGLNPYSAM
jgi:hypothetical protein